MITWILFITLMDMDARPYTVKIPVQSEQICKDKMNEIRDAGFSAVCFADFKPKNKEKK